MREEEILRIWKAGLDKNRLAELYKRSYNNHIKLIRSSVRHRHDSRFITNYEALAVVEKVIYESIMRK